MFTPNNIDQGGSQMQNQGNLSPGDVCINLTPIKTSKGTFSTGHEFQVVSVTEEGRYNLWDAQQNTADNVSREILRKLPSGHELAQKFSRLTGVGV